ncbi:MAG TPA: SET domain-containing protein [Acidimicrobiales bacterium]|nr:SET domain-containing protein [Acidimicrobiales bacterium]
MGLSDIEGRGVFARSRIGNGETVEECPLILFPAVDRQFLDKTVLYNYYFEWQDGDGALALGFGSLYNHSDTPNAEYKLDHSRAIVTFRALKPIEPGTEITVSYGPELWFRPRSQDEVAT